MGHTEEFFSQFPFRKPAGFKNLQVRFKATGGVFSNWHSLFYQQIQYCD